MNITDVNEAPIFTNAIDDHEYWTFQENTTGIVGIVTAEDPDGDPLTYSVSGTDASFIEIIEKRKTQFYYNPSVDSVTTIIFKTF